MTKTLAELRNRTLQKMKVLGAGEVANAEDAALVDDMIASVNEKLRDLEICFWADGEVPESVFEDLAAYVACHGASDFMSEPEAQAYRQLNEPKSFSELKRITSSRPRAYRAVRQDYF
jgi:hypothetical protein